MAGSVPAGPGNLVPVLLRILVGVVKEGHNEVGVVCRCGLLVFDGVLVLVVGRVGVVSGRRSLNEDDTGGPFLAEVGVVNKCWVGISLGVKLLHSDDGKSNYRTFINCAV